MSSHFYSSPHKKTTIIFQLMSNTPEAEVTAEEQPHAPEAEVTAPDAPAEQPEVAVSEEEQDDNKENNKPPVKQRKNKSKGPSHPPYFQMIKEAITALNEKAGSSPYAIAKYMEENHKPVLPANFRKILGLQLKNSVSKGKLIKIKASFKLSEVVKTKTKSSATTTRAARANAVAKPPIKEGTDNKKRKRKSREVSKIDNPPHQQQLPKFPAVGAGTRGRRSKRPAPAPPAKVKQLKSIKSQAGKKAKKVATTA